MKFTIILLIGLTVCFSSTWAEEEENYPLALRMPTGIMDDVIGWIKNAAKGTSKAFMKVISKIVNGIKSLISKWKGSNFEVVIKLANQVFKLKELADDYLIMLGDQIHELLDSFEDSINKVLDILSGKFDEAMDKANHTLFNATTQLQDWRDEIELKLLEEAPKTKYEEGMLIVETFNNKSIADVYSCSEGAIQPIRDLFDKCSGLVNETLPLARELVDNVQDCIINGGWDISGMQTCLINIKDSFVLTIKEFPQKIIGLKTEILKLAINELFNLPCIAGSRIKIEMESATDREINVFNLEHENLAIDCWRMREVDKSLGLPSHPYSKFGSGNGYTLKIFPKEKNNVVRIEFIKFLSHNGIHQILSVYQ